ECANELFGASQTCPACESSLTEPDDVVICSLHPTNDYKTSVLSGLSPALVLEISGRAISFWQYQIHQESLFQAAIMKNVNERNAHLQKQLDNVVREANSELTLLNNKLTGIERDLELERRKTRDLMDAAREKDKEYQKLKTQFDNLKRKTILAPNTLATAAANEAAHQLNRNSPVDQQHNQRIGNMTDIAGGMDANRVQRTPLRQAQVSNGFIQQPARMGMSVGNQQFGLQRRATTTATSRAFNPALPQQRAAVSLSGSEIDPEEDQVRFQRRAGGNGPSGFQSVTGGAFGKGRNAPRVTAQPTQARPGAGGFRPAGAGFGN
ncbi:hypothetical protein FRC08_010564, partial [Ceratobasidium sp. 394]